MSATHLSLSILARILDAAHISNGILDLSPINIELVFGSLKLIPKFNDLSCALIILVLIVINESIQLFTFLSISSRTIILNC